MLKLPIGYLEYGPQKFITSYLKEPQIVPIIDHPTSICIAIDYPIVGAVDRLFELNWAERSCAHLTFSLDGGLLLEV